MGAIDTKRTKRLIRNQRQQQVCEHVCLCDLKALFKKQIVQNRVGAVTNFKSELKTTIKLRVASYRVLDVKNIII
jgi:hypothetical protein